MEFKSTDKNHVPHKILIKDLDTANRTAQVYFASFDNVDYDRDVITKGAFSKTISERLPSNNIKYLMYHDSTRPVGIVKELEQDNFGLLATVQISKNTDGKDLAIMYEEGTIDQHSIGFDIIKAEMAKRDNKSVQIIKEVRLWEGSAVTLGANKNTPLVEIKNMKRLLKRGDLSDEILEQLERQYKEIGVLLAAERSQQGEKEDIVKLASSIFSI